MSLPPIRLLLAEDDPHDVELALAEMRRAGLRVSHRVADTEPLFVQGLREFAPDAILSDFSMPGFDGMEALRLAREIAPWTPFLFVSGTLGEEYAIRALRNGATDYVLKSNLVRLPAAIERALADAEVRNARRNAEAGLARAQLMAKLGHVITGPGGEFESWSESLPELLGVKRESLPRTTREWLDLLHPDDRDAFRARTVEAAATSTRVDLDYRLRRADGEWIHIRQVVEPLSAADSGQRQRWFSTLQDVTAQKDAEIHIRRLNRVHAVLSGTNALIVRARDREELFREACRIAVEDGKFRLAWIGLVPKSGAHIGVVASAGNAEGYVASMPLAVGAGSQEAEGLAGLAIREKRAAVANDIESDARVALRTQALERGFRSLIMLPLIVQGEALGVLALYSEQAGFFDSQEVRLLNELASDVAFAVDHIDKAEKLEYLSYYDPVTGLANRMLLMDRLVQGVAAARPGEKLVLVLLDIERFKAINDVLGRNGGDLLLAQMAKRLSEITGDASRVARIGADRFAVIIPEVRREERVARAIDDGFARVEGEAFVVGGTEVRVAIRSGIALYPNDGADADLLFRHAEAALKKAKEGGDKYLFYTQQMTERFAERLSLENRLRQAIERQEFVLYYQPKVRPDRTIAGLEALIRWQSPQGLVPPLQFVPLLEETGLINPVGAWALRRAALDRRAWIEQGIAAPRVAVNVSPVQLQQAGFVELVKRALSEGSVPPGVDLEITESVIMKDIGGNIAKLEALRALDVDIAVDDFGTGYSSLGYLAKLPVQSLKIDRSFVSTMETDPNAMTLVSTIISLAHSLHLKVVAEGVETEAQASLLLKLSCDELQGYLFSKPLPPQATLELLRASFPRR